MDKTTECRHANKLTNQLVPEASELVIRWLLFVATGTCFKPFRSQNLVSRDQSRARLQKNRTMMDN